MKELEDAKALIQETIDILLKYEDQHSLYVQGRKDGLSAALLILDTVEEKGVMRRRTV